MKEKLKLILNEWGFQYPKKKTGNRIVEDGKVAYVYVNGEKNKGKFFIIDINYIPIINEFTWCYKDGYAVTYLAQKGKKKTIRMHRLIMDVLLYPNIEIDHINGEKNDNRVCNLRRCIKGNDVDNQSNQKVYFNLPDIVDVFVHPRFGNYMMEVSNAFYRKVNIPYFTFESLLKDRKLLYENGIDDILPLILERKVLAISKMLNYLDEHGEHHIFLKQLLHHFNEKRAEAREEIDNNKFQEMLVFHKLKIEDLEEDRLYIMANGDVLVKPSHKSSKEKFENNHSLAVFESDLQGNHLFVQDGMDGGLV
ncbi:hypothetical protein ACFPRB_18180 [Metabacillus niabensis]|uniref:HNH nuclease domain-containing protein n=2 Tax=Metabacillus niabensis TaxID=324854 RepID=A0ABT9Z8M2_9BACI|nr:hypothetical protein [Metabacillus niabensis]MDQ0228598.1 hypothetical protein [Metabacillus niabensis]